MPRYLAKPDADEAFVGCDDVRFFGGVGLKHGLALQAAVARTAAAFLKAIGNRGVIAHRQRLSFGGNVAGARA